MNKRICGFLLCLIVCCSCFVSAGSADPMPRQTADEQLPVPDISLYESILSLINFEGDVNNLENIRQILETPYINVLGSALFYALIFGVPAILIWFETGSAKIPAIIGVIFSGFCVALLPEAWGINIFILIVTVISCGIMWVFVSRSTKE